MRACIVVPTIREESIARFLREWRREFADHTVLVIEDNPSKSFGIDGANVRHYSWTEIDQELGELSWIIPRRTDCIRSFGFYKAYQLQPDFVVSLDDDCYPLDDGFLKQHYARLTQPARSAAWLSTMDGVVPRGVPYHRTMREGECVLSHGLWQNVPDLDAVSQLAAVRHPHAAVPKDQFIPRATYFPMCGMNVAVKTKVVPAFYFLLMGQGYTFDRFGDIWAGVLLKRICDHLGLFVHSGSPLVHHARASDVWSNLKKEVPGLEINERLWSVVDAVALTGTTFGECYAELAATLPMEGPYWDKVKQAMLVWTQLFDVSRQSNVTGHIAAV